MRPDTRIDLAEAPPAPALQSPFTYLSGFGNEMASEAIAGVLPQGQNAPQHPPHGLYTEQLSGTPFTAPRAENRRSWLYRIRPSAMHGRFRRIDDGLWRTAPLTDEPPPSPNRLRWGPLPDPDQPADFVDGLVTLGLNGDAASRFGIGIHVYRAARPMTDRVFYDADGELLLVPQQGRLLLRTEFGLIEVSPGEIAVIPRGVKFRTELPDGAARGYVCENYGSLFRLPELGPIGANGLANPRDFLAPCAAFEDHSRPVEMVAKFEGHLWAAELDHSPLDVVAWHGNYAPYKYDLRTFSPIGAIGFDHPDPSIFTVLTSPSETAGTANIDFVIFPERWAVAENTFRPPWYHMNIMSEFMGLIYGVYDAKPQGFTPGGISLHNMMLPHGPDREAFDHASNSELKPVKLTGTMAFMLETRYPQRVTAHAAKSSTLQDDYADCWKGLEKRFDPNRP